MWVDSGDQPRSLAYRLLYWCIQDEPAPVYTVCVTLFFFSPDAHNSVHAFSPSDHNRLRARVLRKTENLPHRRYTPPGRPRYISLSFRSGQYRHANARKRPIEPAETGACEGRLFCQRPRSAATRIEIASVGIRYGNFFRFALLTLFGPLARDRFVRAL